MARKPNATMPSKSLPKPRARRIADGVDKPNPAIDASPPSDAPESPVVTDHAKSAIAPPESSAAIAPPSAELVSSPSPLTLQPDELAIVAAPEAPIDGPPAPHLESALDAAEAVLQEDSECAIDAIGSPLEIAADALAREVTPQIKAAEIGSIATEPFQAIAVHFRERVEMSASNGTNFFEQVGELARGNVEALVASSQIAAKGFESFGRSASDYGRRRVEEAAAAIRNFAAIRSPTELFDYQNRVTRAAFDDAMAEGSRIGEAMLQLASDISAPIADRFVVAMDRVKSVGA